MLLNKKIMGGLVAVIMAGLGASMVEAETIGLWTFNEKAVGQAGNDGDAVLDTSGSAAAHNGTIRTDAGDDMPYVAGNPAVLDGPALQFERGAGTGLNPGVFDRVEISGHADFTYTKADSYTLEAMLLSDQDVSKTNGTGPLIDGMGSFWMDDDTQGKIMFASGFGDKAQNEPQGVDTRAKVWSTTYVNDGQWHHVAAVFDATAQESRVYVDGILEGATSWAAWAGNASYDGAKGTDVGGTLYFGSSGQNYSIRELDGDLDYVRISKGALGPGDFYYPVPEPSTLVMLLAAGFMGMIALGRR